MPLLIRGPTSQAAPSEYTLAPREAFVPESVTATFNGAAAAAAFLPTLSIYAQSGELLARCPATQVAAGSSAEVTFAPLLRAATAAAAGTAMQWATALGENSAVPSGAATKVSLDASTLLTNNATMYSIDAGAGYTGLGIHTAGTYLIWWGTIAERAVAPQPANPETIVISADEGGLETTLGPQLGSTYGRGFVNIAGHDEWDVSWAKHVQIVSSTGGAPLVVTINQASGQNLDCIVSVVAVNLPA